MVQYKSSTHFSIYGSQTSSIFPHVSRTSSPVHLFRPCDEITTHGVVLVATWILFSSSLRIDLIARAHITSPHSSRLVPSTFSISQHLWRLTEAFSGIFFATHNLCMNTFRYMIISGLEKRIPTNLLCLGHHSQFCLWRIFGVISDAISQYIANTAIHLSQHLPRHG